MEEHIKQCREAEKLKNLPLLWELRSNCKIYLSVCVCTVYAYYIEKKSF